jgi:hypothetical protein
LQACLAALLRPDPGAEGQRDTDIERRELQALADPHLLVFLVQDAKVECGQRDDKADEGGPEPDRRAEPVGKQKFHMRPSQKKGRAARKRRAHIMDYR